MHQPAHKLKFATRGRACPADWSGRPVLKHIPVSVLATYGGQNEDKKRYYSTTKVNFCTIIMRLCHCMIAITMVITALTTLSQGWVSTRKHQCTTAITTMWTESSRAFPESYTTGSCARAMADNRETKGLITPPPRWASAQLLYACVTAW